MNIRSVKGMNDTLPPNIFAWRFAEDLIRKHFEDYGYTEIKTPTVEYTSLFSRSVGETTDIVQKEMYTFNDRNNESLSLRPEGTAPVVRALVEHSLLNQDPVQKLYYWGPMYRYERPQKGRYRQFHQYGVEVFGVAEPRVDAELISMLHRLYIKFELKDLDVRLGSLGCHICRPKYREKLISLLKPKAKELCEDCQKRLEKNPMRIFDCKVPGCQQVAKTLPAILDFLCEECSTHFGSVTKDLEMIGTPHRVDKSLVRGFDYYTRTVFEIATSHLGAQNAIGGGGRYDGLVAEMGGPSTPAVGFAGGVERLILLLGENLSRFVPKLPLFIVLPDERGKDLAFKLVQDLREKGIRAELDYTGKSMKAQMKRADKLAAKFALFLGGSEIDQGAAVLRNMESKAQEQLPLNQLEAELLRRLS